MLVFIFVYLRNTNNMSIEPHTIWVPLSKNCIKYLTEKRIVYLFV